MSNVKLKRSDLHPLRVWGWNCPKCEYWNETDRDPDSCLTEQYDCDGCFHEFEWNTETKENETERKKDQQDLIALRQKVQNLAGENIKLRAAIGNARECLEEVSNG